MLALHQKTVSATWPLLLHLPAFIPLRPLGLWPALATLAMRLWWPTRDIDTELIEQLQTWKHATVAGTTAAIFIRQRAKTKTASGNERDPHPSSSISKETWAILPAACKLWGTSTSLCDRILFLCLLNEQKRHDNSLLLCGQMHRFVSRLGGISIGRNMNLVVRRFHMLLLFLVGPWGWNSKETLRSSADLVDIQVSVISAFYHD